MPHPVQVARELRDWSQVELARRAGVTRQLIGTIEAGRHSPRVDAAVALARALGSTVETLFAGGRALRTEEPVWAVGDPATSAGPVGACRVGDRTVLFSSAGGLLGGAQPWWRSPDALSSQTGLHVLPDADLEGLLVAGCDPALGILSDVVAARAHHRVAVVHSSSAASARALDDGRVHVALVHGPPGTLSRQAVDVDVYEFARWTVGLAGPAGHEVPSMDQIASTSMPVVQRDAGAGTQQAYVRALHAVGATDPPPGPRASGHVEATVAVLHGAPAAITMGPAAELTHLPFTVWEEHVAELRIAREHADHPAAKALVAALSERALLARLSALPGYDTTRTGSIRAEDAS